MNRKCFLCNSTIELLFSKIWMLPGLPASKIGFSICPNCGSVSQSPTVTQSEMLEFYSNMAVYTNPGRFGKPTKTKITDLDEQIKFIKRGIGSLPESLFQIGSSDGYSLSRFRDAGVERVLGLEPSKASVHLAKQLYGVDTILGYAESFKVEEQFELILLTHVLEHLFNPQEALRKCRKLQEKFTEGFIYVEVPLLAGTDSLVPGFFSFEHVNYYTRENLVQSLKLTGYSVISLVEHYNSNLSPVIGVLASTRSQKHCRGFKSEFQENKNTLETFYQKEKQYWQQSLDSILLSIKKDDRVFLWGAGIHTSQLLANTNLLAHTSIDGLLDTSNLKWGKKQGDFVCMDPSSVKWRAGDAVIISSYASEKEIYDSLSNLRKIGVNTYRLHNIDEPRSH